MIEDPSKDIAIACRKLSTEEERELKEKDIQLFTLQSDYLDEELGLTSKLLPNSKEDHSELHLRRVISFGHQKLIGGKSIAEALKLDQHSHWYYLRFSLFQRSKNSFILAGRINEFLARTTYRGKVHLYSSDRWLSKLLVGNIEEHFHSSRKKLNISTDFLFKYTFLFALRTVWGSLRNWLKRSNAKKMIIANPYLVQDLINPMNGKIKKGDPHLQNLIDRTVDDKDFIYLTQLRPPSLEANHKLSLRHYLSNKTYGRRSIYFEPYFFYAYFNSKKGNRFKQIDKEFSEIEKVGRDTNLPIEVQILLKRILTLKKTLKLAVWREVAAEKLFGSLSIEKLIAIDEHSLQNKSIFNAAEKMGIKTYAIQHGAISKGNIAYRFVKEDQAFEPWPDMSFIRGMHNKTDLKKNFYPSHKLKVVGHMRTDVIPALLQKGKHAGEIVYATQPMPPADKKLKEQQLTDFLILCKHFPDEKFVIKPHPNEVELDQYRKLATDKEYPNLSIYESELYYLLASCKILITYYSTVGLEAIYFDKHLITLDYEGRDFQGYTRDAVAHTAMDGNELIKICHDILSGKLESTSEARLKFIERRAYKIDGMVCKRILNEL